MKDLYCVMTVVRREFKDEYLESLKEHGATAVFSTLCNGTAQKKTLQYLGLEQTEKIMLLSVAAGDEIRRINRDFIYKMHIDVPGNGISLTVPINSMGATAVTCLVPESAKNGEREVKELDDRQYSLITIICENGGTDAVMDAARSAGARGGTVVHAKGTANSALAQTFFGISIGSEKEIIYIVSKKQDKDAIMKAVIEKAGANTPTRAIVFSLPVDSVIGLRSLTEDEA